MTETGGPKEASRDAFESKGGEFCGFRRAIGQVRGGGTPFSKTFGQFWIRLVRRCHFSRQIARRRATHAKWKNRFACHAVQQQSIAILGGDRHNVHALAVTRDSGKVRRSRNISIPKIVRNLLEMP